MNRWLSLPEAPALKIFWHDGDDEGAIKRAENLARRVQTERNRGHNMLIDASEKHSATPWKEIQATPVQKMLDDAKAISKSSKRCAVMTTYNSDDCDLDAEKK